MSEQILHLDRISGETIMPIDVDPIQKYGSDLSPSIQFKSETSRPYKIIFKSTSGFSLESPTMYHTGKMDLKFGNRFKGSSSDLWTMHIIVGENNAKSEIRTNHFRIEGIPNQCDNNYNNQKSNGQLLIENIKQSMAELTEVILDDDMESDQLNFYKKELQERNEKIQKVTNFVEEFMNRK